MAVEGGDSTSTPEERLSGAIAQEEHKEEHSKEGHGKEKQEELEWEDVDSDDEDTVRTCQTYLPG